MKLKGKIAILAIIALAAISGAGAMATAADAAASCSTVDLAPYLVTQTVMNAPVQLNCQNVDQVQFGGPTFGGATAWFADYSNNTGPYNVTGPNNGGYVNTTPPHQVSNSASYIYQIANFCYPHGITAMNFNYQFRIHNSAAGSWGVWHWFVPCCTPDWNPYC